METRAPGGESSGALRAAAWQRLWQLLLAPDDDDMENVPGCSYVPELGPPGDTCACADCQRRRAA